MDSTGQISPPEPVQSGQNHRPDPSSASSKPTHLGRNGLDINWGLVRADYLRPDMSSKDVADKWGIKLSTLTKRIYRERWNESRKTFVKSTGEAINQAVTHAVTAAKTAALDVVARNATEQASKLVTEWVERTRQQAEKGVLRAGQYLDGELDPDSLKTVVSALDVADRVGRRALGLDRDTGSTGTDSRSGFSLTVRLETLATQATEGGPVVDITPAQLGDGQDRGE